MTVSVRAMTVSVALLSGTAHCRCLLRQRAYFQQNAKEARFARSDLASTFTCTIPSTFLNVHLRILTFDVE